jgi:hypothetical protein
MYSKKIVMGTDCQQAHRFCCWSERPRFEWLQRGMIALWTDQLLARRWIPRSRTIKTAQRLVPSKHNRLELVLLRRGSRQVRARDKRRGDGDQGDRGGEHVCRWEDGGEVECVESACSVPRRPASLYPSKMTHDQARVGLGWGQAVLLLPSRLDVQARS